MSTNEDHDLILKISEGDSKAFELLLKKYGDLVLGLSIKLLKDRTRAEDMTQETWIRVIKNSKNYSPIGSVKSWILQINRNLIMDYFRAQKKWSQTDDISEMEIADYAVDASVQIDSEEKASQFKTAFAALDERERIVLTMVIVEELQYSEISKNTGLTVGAIKTIVFRAKQKLRDGIKN